MSRIDVAPAGVRATHALVVGVGTYPFCGPGAPLQAARNVRDLTSPPISAHGFVDWLIDHAGDFDAPLSSITLLADPVPGSAHGTTPPTFDEVEAAMQAWQNEGREDDVLLLYWCGHGLLDQNQRRLLLCQDVGKNGRFWRHVVDSRADSVQARASRARTQLWLIDACQEAAEHLKLFNPSGLSTLPDIGANLLAQTTGKDIGLVLSSAEFQLARATRSAESNFCQALKEVLTWRAFVQKGAGRWLVRTTDLVSPINDVFAARGVKQRCTSRDGVGQHPVLSRSRPPEIPATFACDPSEMQAEVLMSVERIGPAAERTQLAAQQAPSAEPWPLAVPAGMFFLSGQHGTQGARETPVFINPNVTRGVLPW